MNSQTDANFCGERLSCAAPREYPGGGRGIGRGIMSLTCKSIIFDSTVCTGPIFDLPEKLLRSTWYCAGCSGT